MIQRGVRAVLMGCLALALTACSGDDDDADDFDCESWPDVQVGDQVQGTLEQGDELDIDGAFLDRYALDLNTSTDVVITMTSGELDSFLRLRREGGQTLASDDDGAGGLNAVIDADLSTGCYLIDATTFEGEAGDYVLTIGQPVL